MIRNQIIAVLLILGAAVPKAAWAQVLSPFDQVKHAVEAQGGVEALRALKRIAIKGEVSHWDRPTFSIVWDLENGMARTDWDRAIRKPAHGHRRQSNTQSGPQQFTPQTATPPAASLVGDWGLSS